MSAYNPELHGGIRYISPKLSEIEIQKCVTRGIQEANREDKVCFISIQAYIFKAVKEALKVKI